MSDPLLTQKIAELQPKIASISGITFDDAIFAQLTTLHLGGRPQMLVRCSTVEAVIEVVKLLDENRIPLLIVGGGSNLVVADGDLDLVGVVLECREIQVDSESGLVRAEAGAEWDRVVQASVDAGLGGIECLSGIPGSAGATPVQNVGAYGAEVGDVLTRVRLLHRESGIDEWVPAAALDLAYRYSNLKFTGRAVVLEIEMQLSDDGLSAPLRFGELARVLEAEGGDRRPILDVRNAVLGLRRGKGMVVDESDHDTWSAGSFFTNPMYDTFRLPALREKVAAEVGVEEAETMPCYPIAGTDQSKLSAAWLIDRAGFKKGFPSEDAPARLSTKHTLALTNRGDATTEDLVELARTVRDGVEEKFGVKLHPEPVWIGVEIDE